MGTEPLEILDNPVTDGEHVSGVCEGRIVAYWPTVEQINGGLRACGPGGYIAAMIVSAWAYGAPNPMPLCNLQLCPDRLNVKDEALESNGVNKGCIGSARYSLKPARGCWTWIPKA